MNIGTKQETFLLDQRWMNDKIGGDRFAGDQLIDFTTRFLLVMI